MGIFGGSLLAYVLISKNVTTYSKLNVFDTNLANVSGQELFKTAAFFDLPFPGMHDVLED